jgi:hypothetical protein
LPAPETLATATWSIYGPYSPGYPEASLGGRAMRKPFDVVVMFLSLWLLTTKIIDVLTPKELDVYIIGPAIAPATILTAVFYYRRIPILDFAIVFSAMWLSTTVVLHIITPKPLADAAAWIGLALPIIVGMAIRIARWGVIRKMIPRFLITSDLSSTK